MSDYTKLAESPRSALSYYYITNGLEFILSVAVYVIFYSIWLRFEWPHRSLYALSVLGALSTLKLFIKPLWQYHCRLYKVDQLSIQYRTSLFIYKEETNQIERLQYLSIKSDPISKVLNLYKVKFMTAGHTICLSMMSHNDVKIIEEKTMSNLRGVESNI